MADIVFDLAITLRYVLDLGDEEMEIVDSGDSEENRDRVPCLHCKKTFKNNTTLGRHCSRFHLEEPSEREERIQTVNNAILTVINDIPKDLCIDDDTRKKISSYDVANLGTSLVNEVSKIFKELKKSGDPDEFYSSYYASIAMNAGLYFPNLQQPACTTFAMKLADKLLASVNDGRTDTSEEFEEVDLNLTDMELGGLQYLCGYIIKNLTRKVDRWTKKCDPKMKDLYQLFIAEDACGQALIMGKNRGGLTAVTDNGQLVFLEIERRFRQSLQTQKLSDLRVKDEIETLVLDNKIVATLLIGIGDQHVDFPQAVKSQCLEMMIELYFTVRINSIIKDIKHTKEKRLRKNIKGPKENVKK